MNDAQFQAQIQKIQTLPLSEYQLDLSKLEAGKAPNVQQWSQLLAAIPPHITILDLSDHCFKGFSLDDIKCFFGAIPRTVKHIELRFSDLGLLPLDKITHLFCSLPPELEELNVYMNQLNRHKNENLGLVFASFPRTLKRLNITGNGPVFYSKEQFRLIFSKLPGTLEYLYLCYGDFSCLDWDCFTLDNFSNLKTLKLFCTYQENGFSFDSIKMLFRNLPGFKSYIYASFNHYQLELSADAIDKKVACFWQLNQQREERNLSTIPMELLETFFLQKGETALQKMFVQWRLPLVYGGLNRFHFLSPRLGMRSDDKSPVETRLEMS
ncbi:hypothetical protein [Legionella shakespearei]|uniref:Leucine-rich repeat-containing protein n=1 Tax=Legionella shakespearei DSM 23087 TaxID=1122169 RepID=A0A0W0Z772_9GAMM|nr:hypothetical protein [Legionella shakespearei]KTD64614.1 leucine-rich repeat-containing protein [Legionella shakespearei DSM 23087]